MRRTLYLLGVLTAIGVVGAVQHTSTQSPAPASVAVTPATAPAPTVANVAMPTLTADEQKAVAALTSRERAATIRSQMDAQIAVRDTAEDGFRAPVAGDVAALASPTAAAAPEAIQLPSGALAIDGAANGFDYLTATLDDSGRVKVAHTEAQGTKGGRRDQ